MHLRRANPLVGAQPTLLTKFAARHNRRPRYVPKLSPRGGQPRRAKHTHRSKPNNKGGGKDMHVRPWGNQNQRKQQHADATILGGTVRCKHPFIGRCKMWNCQFVQQWSNNGAIHSADQWNPPFISSWSWFDRSSYNWNLELRLIFARLLFTFCGSKRDPTFSCFFPSNAPIALWLKAVSAQTPWDWLTWF